jgi:hypothetical protein
LDTGFLECWIIGFIVPLIQRKASNNPKARESTLSKVNGSSPTVSSYPEARESTLSKVNGSSPTVSNHATINPIRQHVKQQSDPNHTCFSKEKKNGIQPNSDVRMQRVKPNAAPIRIKNGRGE